MRDKNCVQLTMEFLKRKFEEREYFADKNSVVFLDEPNRLIEKADTIEKEFCESIQNRISQGKAAPEEAYAVSGAAEVLAKLENCIRHF